MERKRIIWILAIVNAVLLCAVTFLVVTDIYRKGEDRNHIEEASSEEKDSFWQKVYSETDLEKNDSLWVRYYREGYKYEPIPRKCPYCKGDVLPIKYGLLVENYFTDSLGYDLQGRLRAIPGGCVVGTATWQCSHCERKYVLENGKLKKSK